MKLHVYDVISWITGLDRLFTLVYLRFSLGNAHVKLFLKFTWISETTVWPNVRILVRKADGTGRPGSHFSF
jgi:hypothetical protein